MKKIIYFLAALALLSCKSNEELELESKLAQFDQLTEQTMEVHDELMNDMGVMADLEIAIDKRLESDNINEASVEQLIIAKVALEDAHDSMMSWMKDYSEEFPYEAELPETVEQFNARTPVLEQFNAGILEVEQKMENAIATAEGLLSQSL